MKKGERSSPVVYASTFRKTETNDAGEELESEIPFLKEYAVFNGGRRVSLSITCEQTLSERAVE